MCNGEEEVEEVEIIEIGFFVGGRFGFRFEFLFNWVLNGFFFYYFWVIYMGFLLLLGNKWVLYIEILF